MLKFGYNYLLTTPMNAGTLKTATKSKHKTDKHMITLDVTVKNGVPPLPIIVNITCLDDAANSLSFSKEMGFNESYNLAAGRYTLIVNGSNPTGGDTTIAVTGTFQTGPLPDGQYASTIATYTGVFYFVI